eukprot:2439957-Pyramimonas_sp.AAC.1
MCSRLGLSPECPARLRPLPYRAALPLPHRYSHLHPPRMSALPERRWMMAPTCYPQPKNEAREHALPLPLQRRVRAHLPR